MAAHAAMKYGSEVVEKEDAPLTYNDVTKIAESFLTREQAYMAAEIVYALTNDKGRTRQERAGQRYYAGIRETPYAPLVKLGDPLANMTYCFKRTNDANSHMHEVYAREWPQFIHDITSDNPRQCHSLPKAMISQVEALWR